MEKYDRLQRVQKWIDACETEFSNRLNELATNLLRCDGIRILRLSGPTCSGKTTLANLLKARFSEAGKRLHLISIDDFFYDKSFLHQKAGTQTVEALDYDSAATIDWEELSRFIREIFAEQESHCPIFSFHEGERIGYRAVSSREEDIFLFEGIQAFYPEFTACLKETDHESIGVYIAPIRSLSVGNEVIEPNELRLMRRLVRDYNFRNSSPEHTFGLWAGVRRNEENNIFPHAIQSQYQIDSTMPYELGVLKPYLERILPEIPKESPYWDMAEKILALMRNVAPISSEMISEQSLYREFI